MGDKTRNYDSSGKFSGTSETVKGVLGGEYVEHRDRDGNIIGRSSIEKGIFGGEYVEHRDKDGNIIGKSYDAKSVFGGEYIEHRDKDGNMVGKSYDAKGIFGGEYKEHRDKDGQETGRSVKDDSGCFLTSACVEHMGMKDDCYLLQRLRSFRDDYMSVDINMLEDVKKYYRIAPRIVKSIENMSGKAKDAIYDYIFNVISDCVSLYESGNNQRCYSEYVAMVDNLVTITGVKV